MRNAFSSSRKPRLGLLAITFAVLCSTILVVLLHPSIATASSSCTSQILNCIDGVEFGLSNNGDVESGNNTQAGYLAVSQNNQISNITMRFVVPTLTPTDDAHCGAIWTGISGNTSVPTQPADLLQAGISEESVNGSPTYFAWYEPFPTSPTNFSDHVTPGDTITISIYLKDAASNSWGITMNASGTDTWSDGVTLTYASSRANAQWTYENFMNNGSRCQTPRMSDVQVSEAYFIEDNTTHYLTSSKWPPTQISGAGSTVTEVFPSAATAATGAFTFHILPTIPNYPAGVYGPGATDGVGGPVGSGVGKYFTFFGNFIAPVYTDFDKSIPTNSLDFATTGTSSATAGADWQPSLTPHLSYPVAAFIPPRSSVSSTQAHYYVSDYNGINHPVTVDQADNKGTWVSLGTWEADDTGLIDVALRNDGPANAKVVADAMCFSNSCPSSSPPPPPPPQPTATSVVNLAYNYIINSGFENRYAGWGIWPGTDGTSGDAAFPECTHTAHTGSCYGAHWKQSNFEVTTYQNFTNLPLGTYIVGGWFESETSISNSGLYVKDHTNNNEGVIQIPAGLGTWKWLQTTVNVTDPNSAIEVYSKENANQWVRFDDMYFGPINGPIPTPIPSPAATATSIPPTPTPTGPGPYAELLTNPGLDNYAGWCVGDNWGGGSACNQAYDNSYVENNHPVHGGAAYRAHWSASSWYDVTTYQVVTAPVSGNYYASLWFESSCNTNGVSFFLKNTNTGAEGGKQNLWACQGAWAQVSTGPVWFNKGDPIGFEVHSVNAGPNTYWVRFDDAHLEYH